MNGIVMGDGVGILIGAKYRIVTEKTMWAMPELSIGFFPDVGSSYFLNQMPDYIGHYLALTGQVIRAEDVLYIGAADYFMDSKNWPHLSEKISNNTWYIESAVQQLNRLLLEYTNPLKIKSSSQLKQSRANINTHFCFETVEEIFSSLRNSADEGDHWALQTLETLKMKSPSSLKVILKLIQKGKGKPLIDCFKTELVLSLKLVKSYDFYEGVRAMLVDKDPNPKWDPCDLKLVKEQDLNNLFYYSWPNSQNPLG